MASLRARADHQAAVARRLDVLTAELGAIAGESDPAADETTTGAREQTNAMGR